MAHIRAILAALITVVRRDLKTLGSFSGNNLFVVGVTFLFFGDPGLFAAVAGFIALVLFIPLSADPLRLLPRDRLAVWPLSTAERRGLRILSPWLNPMTWLILAVVAWKRVSIGVSSVAAGIFAIGFVLPTLPLNRRGVWRCLPSFPGRLNQLIRKNLREMLSTLDFWCSAVVSAFSMGFRVAGLLPPQALLPMTIITMLPLSTHSQTLFGLDGDEGMTRNRLLPVPGWQILMAKDVPFLLASLVTTLALAPVAGFAAAFIALAIGHPASVKHRSSQVRWRFSSGISFGIGLLQASVMCAAAVAVHSVPALVLLCIGAYGWSTWWGGRALEQQPI